MSVFLVLYYDDEDQTEGSRFDQMKMEEQFSMYSREISNSVIDGGSPVLDCLEIAANGSTALTKDQHIKRYMMIEAENRGQAVELSKGAPLLRRGGRAEVLELSMSSY